MTKEEGLKIKQQILNQLGGEIRVGVWVDVILKNDENSAPMPFQVFVPERGGWRIRQVVKQLPNGDGVVCRLWRFKRDNSLEYEGVFNFIG